MIADSGLGYIHTCFKMPPIGNVRDITPKDAWDCDKAQEVRRKIKNCNIHCSQFGNVVYRRNLLSGIIRYVKYG